MAIWDDIAKKAAALSDKAVKQARDLSEVAKLKLQIAEAEKAVEDSYTQLGRLYAAAHRSDYEEGFASVMAAVTNAEQTVKTLHQQLQDAKGVTVCEKCGAEVAKDAAFCSACGAEIPKPAPVEAEVVTEEAPAEETPAEEAPAEEPEAPAAEVTDSAE
ncbi:MAG: zinc ribbon domain-containing protein [Candidatus Faecousia sp.]|nr:zinc ribbon domain-containing protein [Candidatus Faecousia sp.]